MPDRLVKATEKYLTCSELAGEDTANILHDFHTNLQKVISSAVRSENIRAFDPSYYMSLIRENRLRDIIAEEFQNAQRTFIHTQFDLLSNGCLSPDALNVSSLLLTAWDTLPHRELMEDRIDDLLIPDVYPIHAHNDSAFNASRNLLELIRRINPDKLNDLWQSVQAMPMDAAARNRCEQVMQLATTE
jgi:hypothetical protein